MVKWSRSSWSVVQITSIIYWIPKDTFGQNQTQKNTFSMMMMMMMMRFQRKAIRHQSRTTNRDNKTFVDVNRKYDLTAKSPWEEQLDIGVHIADKMYNNNGRSINYLGFFIEISWGRLVTNVPWGKQSLSPFSTLHV